MTKLDKNYTTLIQQKKDSSGFILSDCCDSLLFTSLAACNPGYGEVDIWAAYDKTTGQWHRRPTSNPCYPNGSKSTISRDMLLGLLWYAWHHQDLGILTSVIDHAIKNYGVMGQGKGISGLSRIWIGPGIFSSYVIAANKLGAKYPKVLEMFGTAPNGSVKGYQAHLQGLHILLRAILVGKFTWFEKRALKKLHQTNPNNPLFNLGLGDYPLVVSHLLKDNLYPSGRLPTSLDRKSGWLPERDEYEWLPSDQDHEHSGGDYVFVSFLCDRYKYLFVKLWTK